MTLSDWPNHIDLREWQKQAIELYNDLNQKDFFSRRHTRSGQNYFCSLLSS